MFHTLPTKYWFMILSPKAIIKLLWEQHARPFCRQAFLLLTKRRPLTGHDTVDSSGIVGMPPGTSRLFCQWRQGIPLVTVWKQYLQLHHIQESHIQFLPPCETLDISTL